LAFKKPNLINYELLTDLESTYVLPIFIKPGRNHFFIRDTEEIDEENQESSSQEEGGPPFFYSRHIVKVRDEPIPKISKQLEKELTSKNFSKEHSVFRDWKEDTPQTIQGCLNHDFRYWKINKFVKDEADLKSCEAVI